MPSHLGKGVIHILCAYSSRAGGTFGGTVLRGELCSNNIFCISRVAPRRVAADIGHSRLRNSGDPRRGLTRCLTRGRGDPRSTRHVVRLTHPVVSRTVRGNHLRAPANIFVPMRVRIGGCHGCHSRLFDCSNVSFTAVGNRGNTNGSDLFVSTVLSTLFRRPQRNSLAN